MDTFFHKNRLRSFKGRVNNLLELPEEKQIIFKRIKEQIISFYGENLDVHFFGSHKNGWWDEGSDYDIVVNEKYYSVDLKSHIEEKLNVKVDVFFSDKKNDSILI
jgi:predicted nucleotidyltransferase